MNINLKETALDRARNLLEENAKNGPILDIENDIGLHEYVTNIIKANLCSTIGIKYELGDVLITEVYLDNTKIIYFHNYTEQAYQEFCKEILNIDINEKFNCSRTINVDGVKTRIYAVMPPFATTPNITISTTKIPPEKLNKQTIPDEVWDDIVHSTFIICGASGSGKTYLMNYLLNKFIRKDERIAIIEEFGELIPPNELVTPIIVPPPKPGEKSLLKFVTEQSNLMRLDATYVGEIKGEEAWPFVVNTASGTRGACTLHGETSTQALNRLKALCRFSCNNDEAINEFISKSINYIITMKDKNIVKIEKLTGTCNRNHFSREEIYS